MFLTQKYTDCLVEYRPVIGMNGLVLGIEVIGDDMRISTVLREIERKADIKRARREGCKTAKQICIFLNGER